MDIRKCYFRFVCEDRICNDCTQFVQLPEHGIYDGGFDENGEKTRRCAYLCATRIDYMCCRVCDMVDKCQFPCLSKDDKLCYIEPFE